MILLRKVPKGKRVELNLFAAIKVQVALQAVTSEELQRSTELFSVVKQLRVKLTNVTEEALDRSYRQHVQSVLAQVEQKLGTLDYESSRQAEVVMARHGLCDASVQQIILLCESLSPALGGAISQIRGMHSAYFADLQGLEESFHEQLASKEQYVQEAKREVEAIDCECSQLMEASALLDAEAARNTDLILSLRQELREANSEVARLQSMIAPDQVQSNRRHDGNNNNFDNSFTSHSSAKMNKSSKFSSSMTTTTSTYRDSASTSAVGSPRMNTSVSRNVKGQVVVPVKSPTRISSSGLHSTSQLSSSMKKVGSAQNQNSFTNDSTRYMDQTKSRKAAWGPSTTSISYNQLSSTLAASSLESTKKSASASVPQTKTIYGSSSKWLMEFRGELQHKMDGNIRIITLKECRALVQQFYECKDSMVSAKVLASATTESKHTVSSHLQDIETMEIHVYRYMEKKYGLRSLAVEHAAMFLAGLKQHSPDNIDILVFFKIFCNEIEEGFVKVQQELEKSIKDLLILQIMNKHSSKDQETLNFMVDEKLSGVLSDHEYMDIVNYLYNEKDATQLRIILGIECQEAYDKRVSGEVNPRSHFEYKNKNIVNESDMKRKLGYVPSARKEVSSSPGSSIASDSKGRSGKRVASRGDQSLKSKNPEPPQLPSDYFDMPYVTFVRLCLQFQLDNHEKYLQNFRASFLYHDSDNDGILSADEFRNCFMGLRSGQLHMAAEDLAEPTDEEIDMFQCLLHLVDPNDTDRITFSNAAERLNSIGRRATTPNKGKKKKKSSNE